MAGGLQQGLSRSGVGGATINIAGQTAVFHGDPIRWGFKNALSPKSRVGRGSNRYTQYRYLYASGGGALTVRALEGDWPSPASQEHTGTIVYTIHKTRTITVPILITGWEATDDPSKTDGVLGTINYVTTGPPVYAGWLGSQPTATAPTASDLQMYNGTVFAIDVNVLQSNGQLTIDWWDGSVADTNAAEIAKLAAYIATVSIPSPLKYKVPSITRDSKDGGTITIPLSLTDTKDDIELPGTQAKIDKSGLDSTGQTTVVFDSGGSTPSDASTPDATLQAVATLIQQHNPERSSKITYFDVNTPAERVIFPEAVTLTDANGLQSTKTIGAVYITGSEPATPSTPVSPTGLVYRTKRSFVLSSPSTSNKSATFWLFAKTTTIEDWTFPRSPKSDDGSDIDDTEEIAAIEASATHSPAAAPAGLEYIETRREKLTDDGQYGYVDVYGRRSKQHAIEYDGSPKTVDGSLIADAYSVTHIEATATPSPAAATDGFLYRGSLILPRHKATTGQKWIHRDDYGRSTRVNDVDFEGTRLKFTFDQSITNEVSTIRIVVQEAVGSLDPAGSAPDPSAFGIIGKVIYSEAQQITASSGTYVSAWMYTYYIATNSAYDRIINQGLFTVVTDTSDDSDTVKLVGDTSTFPGNPTPGDANLKVIFKSRQRLQVAPEKWEFTFKFGRMTDTDKRQLKKRTVDPDDVNETEELPVVHTSRVTAPTTPTQIGTSSNLIKTVVEDLVTASGSFTGLFLWSFRFGPSTEKQLIEQEGEIDADVSLLTGQDVQTLTNNSGTPPADPGTRIVGMVLTRTISSRLQNTPALWKHRFIYGWLTEQQRREYEGTSAERDPLAGYTRETTTILDYGDTAAALADFVDTALKNTDVTYRGVVTKLLAPAKAIKTVRTQDAVHLLYGGGRHTEFDRIRATPFLTSPNGGFGKPDILVLLDVRGFVPPGFVGFYQVYLADQEVRRNRGTYILRSAYLSNLGNTGDIMYESKVNSVNSAAFMGFAAHRLLYAGANLQLKLDGIDGTQPTTKRLTIVDRVLQYDSLEWFSATNVVIGESALPSLLVGQISNGKILGSILKSSLIADWPAATTFTEFLT